MGKGKYKWGIVIFPGSNCDLDCFYVLKEIFLQKVEFIWHKERKDLRKYDVVVLPGGFSYGNYLRAGAIASYSPVMESIKDYGEKGGIIIGICNGFQILCEAKLLEGAFLKNKNLRFICKFVSIRVENKNSCFTRSINKDVLFLPIAHIAGNYFIEEETYRILKRENRILFLYSDDKGNLGEENNPNGSVGNIAGIINKKGNILGMMPHPERACEAVLGSEDGSLIFKSIIDYLSL